MSDDRSADDGRADPAAEEIVLADEDRLPWLEAVEEDEDEGGPSVAKLVAAILIGLVAIGVIVGGLYWLGNRSPSGADNQIITAEKGDYKQVPANPGGMNVSGEGSTSYVASEGGQPRSNLNLNGAGAAPAPQPAPQAQPPARPAPAPAPVAAPTRPAPAPAPAAGPTIQLGAFSTPGAAENAWRALAGRFRYLAPLAHRVAAGPSGNRTVHRLFATGANARDVCNRLRAAGEACIPQ
ncbi:MAG TPA: SPOR domain-containing protein [Allosphingosinicella sp.]|nr:SPOR domain-containing protein [Allosphingosinicella sp.]